MKAICFFNHYHNGDLFNSKSFIQEIISNIDTKYYYAHSNHPIVLSDLNIEHCSIPCISHSDRFVDVGDVLYVNTWIGSYFEEGCEYFGECTLRFSYGMFEKIYTQINQTFGTNLKLGPIENYFPSINYSKFNLLNVNKFLSNSSQRKVLISNGPCLSGQCYYTGDMSSIINNISSNHKDILFIPTHKFESFSDNVVFSGDIIQSNKCDLNEISYISTHCDLIIGRNSGPFCFSSTKENLNNPSKTFYAFGEKETDCFIYGVGVKCNYIFEYFQSLNQLENSIEEILSDTSF